MRELRLEHLSCITWSNSSVWTSYVRDIEDVLEAEISHLDTNDPVKRNVLGHPRSEIGDYITAFGKRESSRWISGRLDAIDLDFTIQHYNKVEGFPNSISWHFSKQFLDQANAFEIVAKVFRLGIEHLSVFYGYADWNNFISAKNKEFGSVDIQSELLGVFWLTYFDRHYISLIGENTFNELPCEQTKNGGMILRLAQTPEEISDSARHECETKLGEKRFANPKDYSFKRPGEYALTFEKLRSNGFNVIHRR